MEAGSWAAAPTPRPGAVPSAGIARSSFARWSFTLLGVALAAVVAVVAEPGPTPALAESFVVSPPSGPPGITIVASGDGYGSNGRDACFGEWFIVFDAPRVESVHQLPTTFPPDVRSGTLVVPSGAAAGDHTVAAICDEDGARLLDSATFTVVRPDPTTTRPPDTTSPTTSPPTVPEPEGPTTTIRGTTTTTRPTSTTSTSTTSTSTPGPTTTTSTTVPPPVDPSLPTLQAVALDGKPSGAPGVGLTIVGTGYADCDQVYFFFDGRRIGAAEPNRAGAVRREGSSVPGDADVGRQTVTASCSNDGTPVRQSSPFLVIEADIHRPAFLTALPEPGDVPLDFTRLAASALVAGGAIALLAFPYQLFNSTLEENYEEVRGWFGLQPKPPGYVPPHQLALLPVSLLVSGLLFASLSPDFGLNQTTLVLAAGLAIAVFTTGVGFALPGFVYMLRQGDRGRVRILHGSLIVGAVTVLISRLVGFTPGYVYGLLAVLVFRKTLDQRRQGRMSALISLFVFAVCLAAWFIRVPVSSAARQPDPNVGILILEAALGGIFLFGLESLLVDLLPMRFLDGSRIKAWSRAIWGTLLAFGLFVLVHVLLIPGSGYVGVSDDLKLRVVVVALYVLFGLISVGFWAYFRYRPERGGTDWSVPRR